MSENNYEKVTLGGGCFWCIEAIYLDLIGVKKVVSGYSGGEVDDPTYKQICTGNTGHAEVIQVTYDPEIITYKELLEIFFTVHDPTTLNRQGNDIGTQYRSVIFYHNDEQQQIANKVIEEFETNEIWDDPIVTEVTELDTFYPAEEYHQNYYAKNPNQGYCRVVIAPKVAKFRKKYENKLKSTN